MVLARRGSGSEGSVSVHTHVLSNDDMRFSRLMISPPAPWTDAHDLMEGAGEGRLIGEAGLFRDIGQRPARMYQKVLGTFNAALDEPSMRRDTEARFE